MAYALVHILGSRSGYTTLDATKALTSGERSELEVLSFGDATNEAAMRQLDSSAAMIGRRLKSGRFAISRMLPGGKDDAGRPTIEVISLVLEPDAYTAIAGALSDLAGDARIWRDAQDAVARGYELKVRSPTSVATDRRVLRAFDTWIAARKHRGVGLLDTSDAAGILGMISLLNPSDRLELRWGVGVLSISAPVDVCTFAPSTSMNGARQVVRASTTGTWLSPEMEHAEWLLKNDPTLPLIASLVSTMKVDSAMSEGSATQKSGQSQFPQRRIATRSSNLTNIAACCATLSLFFLSAVVVWKFSRESVTNRDQLIEPNAPADEPRGPRTTKPLSVRPNPDFAPPVAPVPPPPVSAPTEDQKPPDPPATPASETQPAGQSGGSATKEAPIEPLPAEPVSKQPTVPADPANVPPGASPGEETADSKSKSQQLSILTGATADGNFREALKVLEDVRRKIADIVVPSIKSEQEWSKIRNELFETKNSTAQSEYDARRKAENADVKTALLKAVEELSHAMLTAIDLDRKRKDSAEKHATPSAPENGANGNSAPQTLEEKFPMMRIAIEKNGFSRWTSMNDTYTAGGKAFEDFLCPELCEEWLVVLNSLNSTVEKLRVVAEERKKRYGDELKFPDANTKGYDNVPPKSAKGLLGSFLAADLRPPSKLTQEIAWLEKMPKPVRAPN